MNVLRIALENASNILALIAPIDYDVCSPTALAHFNGNEWTWLEINSKLRNGIVRDIAWCGNTWLVLEDTALRKVCTQDSILDVAVITPTEMFICNNEIHVIGYNGYINNIDNTARYSGKHFFSIHGNNNRIYACGPNGNISVIYNGTFTQIVVPNDTLMDYTSIWNFMNNNVFIAGNDSTSSAVINLLNQHIIKLPINISQIRCNNLGYVYAVSWNNECWCVSNNEATRHSISEVAEISCINRQGDCVVVGGKNTIAIIDEYSYNIIPFDLDCSFLEFH